MAGLTGVLGPGDADESVEKVRFGESVLRSRLAIGAEGAGTVDEREIDEEEPSRSSIGMSCLISGRAFESKHP